MLADTEGFAVAPLFQDEANVTLAIGLIAVFHVELSALVLLTITLQYARIHLVSFSATVSKAALICFVAFPHYLSIRFKLLLLQ